MTAFGHVDNALNVIKESSLSYSEKEPDISNFAIFSESEDFRKMFLEIPDSFWQIIFSKRNAQPQAAPQNPP